MDYSKKCQISTLGCHAPLICRNTQTRYKTNPGHTHPDLAFKVEMNVDKLSMQIS